MKKLIVSAKEMNLVREIVLKPAWWAPVVVLILHKVVMKIGLREQSDGLIHFLGGLAIALFIWTSIPVIERFLGAVSFGWRILITLFAGCTVALFWDLSEFASDELLGTDVQHSLKETMLDLVYGSSGVCLVTAILVVFASKRASA